ncbi:class I SAM-dependent methyltransferase [Nocardia vinacea]|nr:class I SAM-dependent methyltransferase [Nocardia vinacea]
MTIPEERADGGMTSGRFGFADILQTFAAGALPIRVTAHDGSVAGPADSPFGLHIKTPRAVNYLATAPGPLGMARAYVGGDMEVSGVHPGDPYEFLRASENLRVRRPSAAESVKAARALGWQAFRPVAPPPQEAPPRWRRLADGVRHSKTRDSEAIQHHYDVSNAFYEYVLGPSMTYTCAAFGDPAWTLEQAQDNKYRLVFDKLRLRPGDRLLDIGCGWGGMVRYTARRGVRVIGATLSSEQADWAQKQIAEEGLTDLAEVRHCDYRDIPETGFDAVSSIGLTEHIGVRNYPFYFRFIQSKLRAGGLLLNHTITRKDNTRDAKVGAFIDRYVFPDGELIGVGRVISEVHDVGFEVRHEENLREHYAATLAAWCANLVDNWDACVAEVGEGTAKLWGLYMAACRVGFDRNFLQLHQILAVKLDAHGEAALPLRSWWDA